MSCCPPKMGFKNLICSPILERLCDRLEGETLEEYFGQRRRPGIAPGELTMNRGTCWAPTLGGTGRVHAGPGIPSAAWADSNPGRPGARSARPPLLPAAPPAPRRQRVERWQRQQEIKHFY